MKPTVMEKELSNFFNVILVLAAILFCGAVFFPKKQQGEIATGLPVYAEHKDTLVERAKLLPYGKELRLMLDYDTFHITRLYFILPGKGKTYVPQTFW